MKVTVKLFSALKASSGVETRPIDLPDGTTVSQLLDLLRAGGGTTAAVLERSVLVVNQNRAAPEMTLKDGDEVAIFHVLGGGTD